MRSDRFQSGSLWQKPVNTSCACSYDIGLLELYVYSDMQDFVVYHVFIYVPVNMLYILFTYI